MKYIHAFIIGVSVLLGGLAPMAQAADIITNPDDRGSVSQRSLPCYGPDRQQVACPNILAGDFAGAFSDLWNSIYRIVLYILGAVAVLMLVYSGIQYILASNQPDIAKKARQNLINVTLGITLLTAAYAIIRFAVVIGRGVVQ